MKDNKLKVAWDVDDTLIIPACASGLGMDIPNYETIALYHWFQKQGFKMIIWSGGGASYAKMWADKLGLSPCITVAKTKENAEKLDVDIAFDDCDIKLAKINVKVKRINNKIIRDQNQVVSHHCDICGMTFVPDEKAVIFGTKRWDCHTYKPRCKCHDKNFRLCIG